MVRYTDAQTMAICCNELLRLRDKYILDDLERSNAFNMFGELCGYYHDKRSFCMLGHVIHARPWDWDEINAYKKKPNALIFDNCYYQDVALRAVAYMDNHLKPVIEGNSTGYIYNQWRALFNCCNFFLDTLLSKMMFTECNAIYYHCEERCCFCLDTTKALKPLQLIRR